MLRTQRLARILLACTVVAAVLAVVGAAPALAQDKPMSKEEKAMMDAMTKAMSPGENHKLLASLAGNWNVTTRMWVDPSAPPSESTGTAVHKTILGGRYLHAEYRGTMMGMPFEGVGITGYDNLGRQFVSSWIDNFGTGMMITTGSYDPATKAFTYHGEMDDPTKPGTKVKIREVMKLDGPDRHVMEMYELRGGKEARTLEIVYTRKK